MSDLFQYMEEQDRWDRLCDAVDEWIEVYPEKWEEAMDIYEGNEEGAWNLCREWYEEEMEGYRDEEDR